MNRRFFGRIYRNRLEFCDPSPPIRGLPFRAGNTDADDLGVHSDRILRSAARCRRRRGDRRRRRRHLRRLVPRPARCEGRADREGEDRGRTVEPQLGLGAPAGARPRRAAHHDGVEPDLAGTRRGDRRAGSRVHRRGLRVPGGGRAEARHVRGVARHREGAPARNPRALGSGGARDGSRSGGEVGRRHPDPERRPGGTVRCGAGARARVERARSVGHGELRGPHRGDDKRPGVRRRHRERTGAGRPGGARRRRMVDVLHRERGARPAAARRSIHRGANSSGPGSRPAEHLRPGVHHAPARRRRLQRLDRRHRGALPVRAVVQGSDKVPAADEAVRQGPAAQAEAPGRLSGRPGARRHAGPPARSPRSSACGCSIRRRRRRFSGGCAIGCRSGRRGSPKLASPRSGRG